MKSAKPAAGPFPPFFTSVSGDLLSRSETAVSPHICGLGVPLEQMGSCCGPVSVAGAGGMEQEQKAHHLGEVLFLPCAPVSPSGKEGELPLSPNTTLSPCEDADLSDYTNHANT